MRGKATWRPAVVGTCSKESLTGKKEKAPRFLHPQMGEIFLGLHSYGSGGLAKEGRSFWAALCVSLLRWWQLDSQLGRKVPWPFYREIHREELCQITAEKMWVWFFFSMMFLGKNLGSVLSPEKWDESSSFLAYPFIVNMFKVHRVLRGIPLIPWKWAVAFLMRGFRLKYPSSFMGVTFLFSIILLR